MTNVCLVMDNSSVHKEDVVKELCNGRWKYKFIPPYSPNLNPIENIFGIFKKKYEERISYIIKGAIIRNN